ncbi:hypothetical protein M3Y99_01326200 [Aphelenchoides fujianensis]|nr:hypothetical protein M3Y99_01326200 [Aphelenchoides fujianensis]
MDPPVADSQRPVDDDVIVLSDDGATPRREEEPPNAIAGPSADAPQETKKAAVIDTIELDDSDEVDDEDEEEEESDDGSVSCGSSNESRRNMARNPMLPPPRSQGRRPGSRFDSTSSSDEEEDRVDGRESQRKEASGRPSPLHSSDDQKENVPDEAADDSEDSSDHTFDEEDDRSEADSFASTSNYLPVYTNDGELECFDLRNNEDDDEEPMDVDAEATGGAEDGDDAFLTKVPDAWTDSEVICGANSVEEEEQRACALFEQTQKYLTRWNANPHHEHLGEKFFSLAHKLLQTSAFKRLRKHPFEASGTGEKHAHSFNPTLHAYFTTHKQLGDLVHNSVPHRLQVLAISPADGDSWYAVGRLAAEAGDWKNAEFAYRRFAAVPHQRERGLQAIALVHFVSGDFLRCIQSLKDVLSAFPSNLIGNVLLGELRKKSGIWAENLDLLLVGAELKACRKNLEPRRTQEVLDRIRKFQERVAARCVECDRERKCLKQGVNRLTLTAEDVHFTNFTAHLLAFYDVVQKNPKAALCIEYPNSTTEELPKSTCETTPSCSIPQIITTAPTPPPAESPEPLVTPLVCLDEPMDEGGGNAEEQAEISALVDDLLVRVESQELEQKADEPAIPLITIGDEADEPPTKRRRKSQSQAFTRRSTRFLEEPTDDRSSQSQSCQHLQNWDVKNCLNVDRNADFEWPPAFAPSVRSQLAVDHAELPPSLRSCPPLHLGGFLNELMNSRDIPAGLSGYLFVLAKLMSFAIRRAKGRGSSLHREDRLAFLRLYHKWTHVSSLVPAPTKVDTRLFDLFAAEIGSEAAATVVRERVRKLNRRHTRRRSPPARSSGTNGVRMEANEKETPEWMQRVERSGDSIMKSLLRTYRRLRRGPAPELPAAPVRTNERSDRLKAGDELVDNRLIADLLHQMGADRPLDFRIHDSAAILCAPADLPDGLVAPQTKLLDFFERQFVFRFHWLQAAKHRCNGRKWRTPEEQAADEAFEWKHLMIAMKIVDEHRAEQAEQDENQDFEMDDEQLEMCAQDLGFRAEELEWAVGRLVLLVHEIKKRFCLSLAAGIDPNDAQNVDAYIEFYTRDHDYTKDSEEAALSLMKTLYCCHAMKGDVGGMFDSILRISKLLLDHANSRKPAFMAAFQFCLRELDRKLDVFLSAGGIPIDRIAKLLTLFTEKSFYRTTPGLWLLCYRLARHEAEDTEEEFEDFFDLAKNVNNLLPTRGLMILREAHEIMSDEGCCMRDQGAFMRFYLRELNATAQLPAFQVALQQFVSAAATELKHTIESEIIQAVMCLHGISVSSRKPRIRPHRVGDDARLLDWATAELVLPFLFPDKTPLFDDNHVLRSELTDLIRQFLPLLLAPLDEALRKEFARFERENHEFTLSFALDENGQMSDADPMFNGRNMLEWPSIDRTKLTDERRQLAAMALYLHAFHLYRQTAPECSMAARCVLMFGRDALPAEFVCSNWMIVAKTNTNILQYPSLQLFEHMDELFFPFRMALLLHKEVAEGHLDLAVLLYQCHARVQRFIRLYPDDPIVPSLRPQIRRIFDSCLVHCRLAEIYKTRAIDISWLTQYFLGKLAEKRRESIDVVLGHYWEVAQRMHDDQYTFPVRISRKNQLHFEPLELFYRVHVFLDKRRQAAMRAGDVHEMRRIVAALIHWSAYGVSRNVQPNAPPFFHAKTTDVLAAIDRPDGAVAGGDEIRELMSGMVEIVALNEEARRMVSGAYESILQKFPHYKAVYRLAKILAADRQPLKAIDLYFNTCFPNKKRIGPTASIFENFVEIQRSDIERSRSLDYHMTRLITDLTDLLRRERDCERLAFVAHSLLTVNKPEDELISGECVEALINVAVRRLLRVCAEMNPKENARAREILYAQLPLLSAIERNVKKFANCTDNVEKLQAVVAGVQAMRQDEQRRVLERQQAAAAVLERQQQQATDLALAAAQRAQQFQREQQRHQQMMAAAAAANQQRPSASTHQQPSTSTAAAHPPPLTDAQRQARRTAKLQQMAQENRITMAQLQAQLQTAVEKGHTTMEKILAHLDAP